MKFHKGLSKDALVQLWREQIEARELDLLLHGPLFHDVFEPDFDAWRFYEDGTESGSTPIAAQNTSLTARNPTTDPKIHLRARIQEIGAGTLGGATTDDYGLEYSHEGGAYVAVTASSSFVRADTASGLTADAATTNRGTNGITDGIGAFVAGEQEETNGVIEDHQLTADNFTEHVWALTLVPSDLADGDTLDFRITLNAGAPGMTNTVVPRITIVNPPDFDQVGFRFYEDSAVGADSLTGMAAEKVNAELADPTVDTYFHYRGEFENSNNVPASAYTTQLWVSKNSGAYYQITTTSNSIQAGLVANVACTTSNGDNTLASLLTTSAKTFAQAEYEAEDSAANIDGAADTVYENHFALKIVAADVGPGDTFDFRYYRNATDGAFGAYTSTGRLTIPAPGMSATVSQAAPIPTQSATGGQEFSAAAAQTAPTPSQAATGGHESIATAAQTAPTPSQTATGAEEFIATAAQTAPTPSQSATGAQAQEHTATGAQTAPTPTQAATGIETLQATAAQISPTPSQAATGFMHPDATVAQTAPTPSQSATGAHASANMAATAAQTAPTPTQAATASEIFTAVAAQTMPTPTQSATSTHTVAAGGPTAGSLGLMGIGI